MDPVLGICGSLLRVAVTWPKRFAVALKELDPSQIIATHDDDELLHDSCRLLRSCITSKEYIQASWERLRAVEDVHAALERCHPSPEISSIMDLVLGIHGSLLHVVAPWPKRFVIALKELDPSQVFFVKTPPDLEVVRELKQIYHLDGQFATRVDYRVSLTTIFAPSVT
ncbi:hypothetical protein CDL15_Pgr005777 [Punica granatum]|uniref:Uncharacterized protein n=1 Tax=Punica granatum TaxID=22663 RepID=A0A218WGW5_PUNGR|nr:hypothetical protein CDL15_Pgr005777 [Punica granatum]